MAMLIHVDIVSTEKEMFSGLAAMVIVPAKMGVLGILPCHAPLLSPLRPGVIQIKKNNGTKEIFYVSGGILEVQPSGVIILADTIIRGCEIDKAAALEAKKRAEKMLSDKQSNIDYTKVHTELAEAMAQLRTIRHCTKITN